MSNNAWWKLMKWDSLWWIHMECVANHVSQFSSSQSPPSCEIFDSEFQEISRKLSTRINDDSGHLGMIFQNEQFYLSKSFFKSLLVSYDCWKLTLNIQYFEGPKFYGILWKAFELMLTRWRSKPTKYDQPISEWEERMTYFTFLLPRWPHHRE